ncbi:hypothetical protein [Cellulomonas composti]|uniref:Uncharacterized protein n=1 Tax=Cellulomonas composti TaxID=266130 RepID=A0A511J6U8_9CELL|nr:hypothetical protein [Cellulomonas composti]GEL93708.1 hypothetical protein CCO02nite_03660 [Cellulomonas composti]
MSVPVPLDPPAAPGRLGESIPATDLLTYLAAMEVWTRATRTQLDHLDAAAHASSTEGSTSDVVLALTMWQAIRDRLDELVVVWDSGRADAVAREQMSQLIWGRLASAQGSALVSLVEAVRLCDAMVDRLRERLAIDPDSEDQAARLRVLRAALVRCEDAAGIDAAAVDRVAGWRDRERALLAQVARGADVSGPLAELESAVARGERDLIVEGSQRRTLVRQRADARTLAQSLEEREPTLHQLAERCRREVVAPPRLAVPDVSRLGDVPETREEVEAFVERLRTVQRAFDTVADAYSAPLRERAELRYRLEGYRAAADTNGRSASTTVRSGYDEARAAVETTPCDVVLARFLVEQYQFLTRDLPAHGEAPR